MSFSTLPVELQVEIFSYFNVTEQFTLVRVCTSWETIFLQTKSLRSLRYVDAQIPNRQSLVPDTPTGNRPFKHYLFNPIGRPSFRSTNGSINSYLFVHENEEKHLAERERVWMGLGSDRQFYKLEELGYPAINLPKGDVSNSTFLNEPIFAAPVEGASSAEGLVQQQEPQQEPQQTDYIHETVIGRAILCDYLRFQPVDYEYSTLVRPNTTVRQFLEDLARDIDEKFIAQRWLVENRLHEVEISQFITDGEKWRFQAYVHRGVPVLAKESGSRQWWQLTD
ncbi:hypothetical protein ABW20_dc0105960 [Dactylellina cionopaga]|nr:hypothetical protein ABW20_dc0105960 [Dactylellina cionopaga]